MQYMHILLVYTYLDVPYLPHTLIIPSRAGYGVCKRLCTRVWCTSTREAIYGFVSVFYECTFHRAIPWAPGYMESIPLGGGYRVHTLIPGYIPGYGTSKYIYEVTKKKYIYMYNIAYTRAILYIIIYTILVIIISLYISHTSIYRCNRHYSRPTQRFTYRKGWLVDLSGAEGKKQHRCTPKFLAITLGETGVFRCVY